MYQKTRKFLGWWGAGEGVFDFFMLLDWLWILGGTENSSTKGGGGGVRRIVKVMVIGNFDLYTPNNTATER